MVNWEVPPVVLPGPCSTRACLHCCKTKNTTAFAVNKYFKDVLDKWCSYCFKSWEVYKLSTFTPMVPFDGR